MVATYLHLSRQQGHFGRIVRGASTEVEPCSQYAGGEKLILHHKRSAGIRLYLKISFAIQLHLSTIVIEMLGISKSGMGIEPHFAAIWQQHMSHTVESHNLYHLLSVTPIVQASHDEQGGKNSGGGIHCPPQTVFMFSYLLFFSYAIQQVQLGPLHMSLVNLV